MHRPGRTATALLAAGALAVFALGEVSPAIAHEAAAVAHKINGSSIAKHSVAGNRLKKNTVTGKQIKESSLGKVPVAAKANSLPALVWHDVTLKNGWTAGGSGFGPPQWAVDAQGIVHLRGWASGGTAGTTVFSLPTSMTETYEVAIPILNESADVSYLFIPAGTSDVEVFDEGSDTHVTSGVFFNGISFVVG